MTEFYEKLLDEGAEDSIFIKWPFISKRPFRSLITNRLLIIASKIAAE